jgi:beta-galactosidase beta subunit
LIPQREDWFKKKKWLFDGDSVFASVTENAIKGYDSTQWKSHRKNIDIQYVIEDEECMGLHPLARRL